MIATRNSIKGEVFQLQRNLKVPFKESYLKLFNSKQFVTKVANQMQHLHPEYEVTFEESEEEYILRVNEYD